MGHYQFFETNQSHLCATVNSKQVRKMSGQHVYTMICGQMTPSQKQIVQQQSKIDAVRYTALLDWYIKESGHPGYENFVPSEKCPQPTFIDDGDTRNNTDDLANLEIENKFVNITFDFLLLKNHHQRHLCMTVKSNFL